MSDFCCRLNYPSKVNLPFISKLSGYISILNLRKENNSTMQHELTCRKYNMAITFPVKRQRRHFPTRAIKKILFSSWVFSLHCGNIQRFIFLLHVRLLLMTPNEEQSSYKDEHSYQTYNSNENACTLERTFDTCNWGFLNSGTTFCDKGNIFCCGGVGKWFYRQI